MNILLISDSYPPEIRSASKLMQELAEGLRDRGHSISVITSYPQYNLSHESNKSDYKLFTQENGINILRVKTLPHHNVNFLFRGISQLTLPHFFISKLKRYLKEKPDIIIVYSPPLPLMRIARWFKIKYNNIKVILNVQDIFPQNAIDLGIMKNILVIKFFENLEKQAYKTATYITVHSQNNKKFLIKNKSVENSKINIINNWIDISPYININKRGSYREKYNLNGKFIFLFAGVFGPSQNLELIINAAQVLKHEQNICFLLVGDGSEKEKLFELTRDYSLNNVIFKPFVSMDEYPYLVTSVDVGVVCLSSKNKTPVVPAKILGYMAASIPIVAFLNKESDGHSIIKEAKCGYSTLSDNQKEINDIFIKIHKQKNQLDNFGLNGFNYLKKHFSKDACIDNIEKMF
jgi:glycosyltransferase involved in cell wall biosynthesis